MSNRIIKESIRTSKTVNGMTDFQFRCWVYLITYVDDYGRGSADPELIKGFVFPRRKRISESDIEKALADLAGMGCISLYEVDGESYFYFPNWGAHQRIQTKKSRFPPPESCVQRNSTVIHGESPPESESEYESKSETEAYASCAAPETAAAPPAITLPLNDGTEFPVSAGQIREWSALYPAVDVEQQLRNMLGWLSSRPERRKTRRGVRSFITNWLAKEQNRGGAAAAASAQPYARRVPCGSAGQGELSDLERRALAQMLREDEP